MAATTPQQPRLALISVLESDTDALIRSFPSITSVDQSPFDEAERGHYASITLSLPNNVNGELPRLETIQVEVQAGPHFDIWTCEGMSSRLLSRLAVEMLQKRVVAAANDRLRVRVPS